MLTATAIAAVAPTATAAAPGDISDRLGKLVEMHKAAIAACDNFDHDAFATIQEEDEAFNALCDPTISGGR